MCLHRAPRSRGEHIGSPLYLAHSLFGPARLFALHGVESPLEPLKQVHAKHELVALVARTGEPVDVLAGTRYLWRVRARALAAVKEEAERAGVPFSFEEVVGKAGEVIVRLAREHQTDLIVMGSEGSGTSKPRRVRSISKQVAHHSPCPVLFVR